MSAFCDSASAGTGRLASTFSSAARTSVSTDFMSSGMLSAALVPAVIGLWEGAAGVAFAVVRAGWMGGGPASW